MSAPAIAYDLTRLVLGPTLPVPRGIDRVDLGFADYFFDAWQGDCMGVLPLPLGLLGGMVSIRRPAARKLLKTVARLWNEDLAPQDDAAFAYVAARLAAPDADHPQPDPPSHFRPQRIVTGLLQAAFGLGGVTGLRLRRAVPKGAVYVNTGQLGLAYGWLTAWLERRPDIRRVHMLHDAIPLEYPDLVPASSRTLHARMIGRTARGADGLIVTTEAVRASVLRELAAAGRDKIATLAAPLPVAPVFLKDAFPQPDAAAPYFVVLGSIEPRKNHRLLLEVWRHLGADAPKLVIAGTPWRDADGIAAAVAADPGLRRSVILVSGLASPALRHLVRGAAGLLQPSLIEGFGLPIIEALALGTPVIASDQPAHREAGGAFATYCDARDTQGWETAIRAVLAMPTRVTDHRPWDWDRYGAALAPFLAQVAAAPRYDRPA